jgi:hypothetical protein
VAAISTTTQSHTHDLCVPTVDLANPPVAGATYTTSNVGGHSHAVTFTQAQLSAINSGSDVTVESSITIHPVNNAAHTHTFSVMRLPITPSGGTSGGH